MKTIKDYISFAIDNEVSIEEMNKELKIVRFDFHLYNDVVVFDKNDFHKFIDITRFITSKPFIEAIARGINKIKDKKFLITWAHILNDTDENRLLDIITFDQAIAIRDNKLEEYINNILPND